VSTAGLGKSGLGLEARGGAIAQFAAQEGFRVVESSAEIEIGKGADALDRRPKLAAALKAARKLDRGCPVYRRQAGPSVSRRAFIRGLMQYPSRPGE
jgi:hypothetical protein